MNCKTANYSDGGASETRVLRGTELGTFYMVFFDVFWHQWK